MEKQKAIFFSRDGVINEFVERLDGSFTSPWLLDEFKFHPYVKDAINIAKDLGFLIFVIADHPKISDCDMDKSQVDLINRMMTQWLGVDDIATITDDYDRNIAIQQLADKHNVDKESSYLVGEYWKDIVAGHQMNIPTIFVGSEYIYPFEFKKMQPEYVCIDVLEACNTIMEIENARV